MKRKYLGNAASYYVTQKLLIKKPLAQLQLQKYYKITIYFASIFLGSGIPDSTQRGEIKFLL